MKKFLLILALSMIAFALVAQDTTIVFPDPGPAPVRGEKGIVEFILSLIPWLIDFIGALSTLLLLISILIRRISTNINLDPLFKIIKFLDDLGEKFGWLRNKSSVGKNARHIVTTVLKKEDD